MGAGPILFAICWICFWSCMAIWPKWFYEHSKLRGELSNGPFLTRIVGIAMICLPIAGIILFESIQ